MALLVPANEVCRNNFSILHLHHARTPTSGNVTSARLWRASSLIKPYLVVPCHNRAFRMDKNDATVAPKGTNGPQGSTVNPLTFESSLQNLYKEAHPL